MGAREPFGDLSKIFSRCFQVHLMGSWSFYSQGGRQGTDRETCLGADTG